MTIILPQNLFRSVTEGSRVPDGWEWAIPIVEKSIGSVYKGKVKKAFPWVANGGICVSLTTILCLSAFPFKIRIFSLG